MARVLGRDDFLSESRLNRELVDVPELGGSVWLRELDTRKLLEYNHRIDTLKAENPTLTPEASIELMAMLIANSACDENGDLLFTEEDVAKLAENRLGVLTFLSTEVLRVSKVGKKAEEVGSYLKNALPNSSATGSPRSSRKQSRKSKPSPPPNS